MTNVFQEKWNQPITAGFISLQNPIEKFFMTHKRVMYMHQSKDDVSAIPGRLGV